MEPMININQLYGAMALVQHGGISKPDTTEPYVPISKLSKHIPTTKIGHEAVVDYINQQFGIEIPYGRPRRDYWAGVAEEVTARLIEKFEILEG